MSYLKQRQSYFEKSIAKTRFQMHHPLTAGFQISPTLLAKLQSKVFNYMAASCHEDYQPAIHRDTPEFLSEFARKAKNLSTSGIIIPKNYCDRQFTEVHQVFSEILMESQLGSEAEYWIYPFNVRLKGALPSSASAIYPTEMPHSETWVGCSLRSVLLHVPLLGDTENNCLKVRRPSEQFTASGLRPLDDYRKAEHLIAESSELPLPDQQGQVVLVDSALLHGTHRNVGAGPRVSLDFNVVLKCYDSFPDDWNLLADRQKMTTEDFFNIGKTLKVVSPDGEADIHSPKDGMRHPANIKIVNK